MNEVKAGDREGPPADQASGDPYARLATRAANGDVVALGTLLRALAPLMLRVARGMLGPAGRDAEDVVQESLLGLARALVDFRGESTVAHYAARITIRTAVVARRRSRKREAPIVSLEEGPLHEHRDRAVLPDDAADAKRRREALNEVLASIPTAQAETLVMRVVLGHSLEEIAEATVVPVNTVRSRLRLAKEALARQIALDPLLLDILEIER